MAKQDKSPAHIKLDERNHVEKPFLDQLAGLGWEVLDLDSTQHPADSFRESFTEVVMPSVLREQIGRINPWMEPDQIEEVVKQLTASFPGNNLIENNRHLLGLLLEGTSVSENRQTGEKSPTVRFIEFEADHEPEPTSGRDGPNRFIAVCQFKVRILGTEHHVIPDIVLFVNG
ncbi:MAG: restriction endonuclease subunit R, partial [Alphaproteobacteria bacterium]|nr:restriction endonuclease subunit R [Alphaproteobacteria bacterium]